jgi:hypothetical protein
MSTFQERVNGLSRCGNAASKLAEDHKQLFFSIPVEETFQKIVAVIRTDQTINPPQNEDEAFALVERVLAELLYDGRIKVSKIGLSPFGRESFEYLVNLHQYGPPAKITDPKAIFADVVKLYRADMPAFLKRRAEDPEFLKRSDEANALKLY